jgi:hypothetical protein
LSLQALELLALRQPVAGIHESFVHTLASSQLIGVPWHAPPEQVSLLVQALPSLQEALLLGNTQPCTGSQVSVVHTLPSLQVGAGPPTQAPPEQVSFVVQALPSLQAAELFKLTQPVVGVQESSVQTLLSSQFGGAPPTQAPRLQTSFVVQKLPSLHIAVLFSCIQPVAGMHESLVQTFPSSQLGGVPPTHNPPEHMSSAVQAFPSLHGLELLL